jgi:hypothetical protein
MRKIYPAIFVLLALSVCVGAQPEPNSGAVREEQRIFSVGGTKFVNRSMIEKNESKLFEIKVDYPELAGAGSASAAKFNQLIKETVMKEVREFRKISLAQADADSAPIVERSGDNFLEMNYRLDFATERILTVVFGSTVYDGGARPNQSSWTINFDLKTGKKIELADIFKPNSNYLKVLSDYSIRNLKQTLAEMSDEEWLENGAGAQAENFDSWNITKKGLLINFDPYRVASPAAGGRQVLIPYSELKNILSENGLVAQ